MPILEVCLKQNQRLTSHEYPFKQVYQFPGYQSLRAQ